MKNNTSIIASLLGGIVLGSVVTCLVKKHYKFDKNNIHTKIMDELEQLRNFVAAHHPDEICSCSDPACNCNPQE